MGKKNMGFYKKAITPAISWILIIGMAVTLAGVVTFWIKSTATTTTEKIITNTEIDLRCDDVSFNAYESTTFNCSSLTVHNRGFFSLQGIKIRQLGSVIDHEFMDPLKPQEQTTITLNNLNIPSNNEMGLIPIISAEKEDLACMNKEISVKCK